MRLIIKVLQLNHGGAKSLVETVIVPSKPESLRTYELSRLRFFALFLLQPGQVFLPLHRKGVLFFVIALLARCNEVVFCRSAAPHYRHNVVHGKLFRRYVCPAVITFSFSALLFPPLRFPEFPGLLFFFFYLLLTDRRNKRIHAQFLSSTVPQCLRSTVP